MWQRSSTRAVSICVTLAAVALLFPAHVVAYEPIGFPGVPLPPSPVVGQWDSTNTTDSGVVADCYSLDLAAGDRFRAWITEPEGLPFNLWLHASEDSYPLVRYVGGALSPRRLTYLVPEGDAGTYYLEAWVGVEDMGPYEFIYTIDQEPYTIARIGGSDRYATALAVSQSGWPTGSADTVVIASGEDYPDALCGSPLAGLTGGPVLLNAPDRLLPSVATELERLGASTVYVLGGRTAISQAVEDAIAGIPGIDTVHRLGGSDRYATSRAIADELYGLGDRHPGPTYLVRGDDFADAVACSAVAAFTGKPILLTRSDVIHPATKALAVRNEYVLIVGGDAAVSAAIEHELAYEIIEYISTGEGAVLRVHGRDRYETAANMALEYSRVGQMGGIVQIGVASGEQYADALVAGPHLARLAGCLLLSRSDNLSEPAQACIATAAQPGVDALLVGGEAALSRRVEEQLGEVLGAIRAE